MSQNALVLSHSAMVDMFFIYLVILLASEPPPPSSRFSHLAAPFPFVADVSTLSDPRRFPASALFQFHQPQPSQPTHDQQQLRQHQQQQQSLLRSSSALGGSSHHLSQHPDLAFYPPFVATATTTTTTAIIAPHPHPLLPSHPTGSVTSAASAVAGAAAASAGRRRGTPRQHSSSELYAIPDLTSLTCRIKKWKVAMVNETRV